MRLQRDTALLLIRRYAKSLSERLRVSGQEGLIYFVSDLDPSGLDLQRAWEAALKAFGAKFEIKRVALTETQVDNLPDGAARLGILVKPSDSRARRYVARYGERCWEADILPGSVIRQAIRDHILSWLDVELWDRRNDEIEAARRLL